MAGGREAVWETSMVDVCWSGVGERLRALVEEILAQMVITTGGGSSAQNLSSASIHAAVPPVLDSVVAASMETTSYLSPSLSHLAN